IQKELISLRYPSTDSYFYIKQLANIKQSNFALIDQYHEEIKTTCKKWGACKSASSDQIAEKINETFINNLHYLTEIEMNRSNNKTLKEILLAIKTTERTLIRSASQITTQRQQTNFNTNTNKSNENNFNNKKYCKYHKTHFHDTKDCNFLKAQQQNRNPTDKNLAINDAKSNKNDLI
ncbi:hypothetical protein M153_27414000532, partial [Pseudoloma neurophilia]